MDEKLKFGTIRNAAREILSEKPPRATVRSEHNAIRAAFDEMRAYLKADQVKGKSFVQTLAAKREVKDMLYPAGIDWDDFWPLFSEVKDRFSPAFEKEVEALGRVESSGFDVQVRYFQLLSSYQEKENQALKADPRIQALFNGKETLLEQALTVLNENEAASLARAAAAHVEGSDEDDDE